VRLILPAPGRLHADHVALSLANEILGGSFKRFERTLRDERGWAYSVTSALLDTRFPGLWFASGRFFYPRTAAAIEYMLEQMAELGAGNVTVEELADAKRALVMRASRAEADARQVAQRIASRLVFGNPEPDLATEIGKIEACTREDVVAAARRTLRPDQVLIVVVGDPAALSQTLVRLGPVELWKPTDHTYHFERELLSHR
jgi:zinc protease